jgi:hypothetical protein
MALTDRALLKQVLVGLLVGAGLVNPINAAAQLSQRHQTLRMAPTAATNVGTFKFMVLDRTINIIACRVWSDAAVALNASNYAGVNVQWSNDQGGAATNIAAFSTQATSLVANQSLAMPLNATAANYQNIPAGSSIEVNLTSAGTGVALGGAAPQGWGVDIIYEEVGP